MPHIHWVARKNKLEIPNDEEEVNTREIHRCDGQAHDPDTMVDPLTPKPTRKAEALAKTLPTIASRREEDVALNAARTAFLKLKQTTEAPQRKKVFSFLEKKHGRKEKKKINSFRMV
jgi:hypothetical protein